MLAIKCDICGSYDDIKKYYIQLKQEKIDAETGECNMILKKHTCFDCVDKINKFIKEIGDGGNNV